MNFIKRWKEKRKNRKEFDKFFSGILGAMKEMLFSDPKERETHEHAEIITKNMFLANGCDDVNVFIRPEGDNVTKAKIDLIYHGQEYGINITFREVK